MQPTPQQQQAIHTHDRNLIVIAGAGSGKTHVLVERYMALLAHYPDWPLNALVAITFTKAAAMEMRDRVRKKLMQLRHEDADNAPHWSGLLAQMDSARIDTIHALCGDILRANAAQAGIDPAFEVLDEVSAGLLLAEVVDDVLQALAAHDPDGLLALYTEYPDISIGALLTDPNSVNADLPPLPEDVLALWQAQWQAMLRAHMRRLQADAAFMAALDWQLDGPWPQDDKLTPAWDAIHASRDALLQTDDLDSALAAMQHVVEQVDLRGGKAGNWGGKEGLAACKAALRYIREALQALLPLAQPLDANDARAADLVRLWHGLLTRVQGAYRLAKRDAAQLDFDDLERLTAALLTQNADVRQRYAQGEFKHLLVDEFQDTNQRQWQIIKALADVGVAGTLFVVGDPKQSIYGFRGADVSVFGSVRDEITHNVQLGVSVPLAVSFRTHAALINIFNKLFAHILTRDDFSPVAAYQVTLGADDVMSAQRADTPTAPHLEMTLLDEASATGVIRNGKPQTINSNERREWEAYEIATRLQRMAEDPQARIQIFGKSDAAFRPFGYGDAAVLFRATTNIPIYEAVFKSVGVPFVTIAGRGYYDRQEVWDMLNLLRALHNTADHLALAAALRSPLFGFSDDLLLLLRNIPDPDAERDGTPIALWDALAYADDLPVPAEDAQRVRFAHGALRTLHSIAGRVTISELLRQALAMTGYPAVLQALSGGKRRRRNVEKLVDIADASGRITLGAFAAYIDDLTGREVREGEALLDAEGAVQLMSVHASKGLEFPVVVLADATWERSGGGGAPLLLDSASEFGLACRVYDADEAKTVKPFAYRYQEDLQQQREEAESKRLFYVAATRARDRLLVYGGAKRDRNGVWSQKGWLGLLLKALDLTEVDQSARIVDYVDAGVVDVQIPTYDPTLPDRLQTHDAPADYADDATEPFAPPLLEALPQHPNDYVGHITVTQLGNMGAWRYPHDVDDRRYHQQALRLAILHDAPSSVRALGHSRTPRLTRRVIGDIVHEALRYWHFDDTVADLDDVLRGHAWRHNVTDPDDVERAVAESRKLLNEFRRSDLSKTIDQARAQGLPVHPEMPFVYRTEKRILHGVIDLVFQRADGRWCMVDYKTSYVKGLDHDRNAAIEAHVRRYYLQVGAYAAALGQQLGGVLPDVYVHYIRYTHTARIQAEDWQRELSQLEAIIGDMVDETLTPQTL